MILSRMKLKMILGIALGVIIVEGMDFIFDHIFNVEIGKILKFIIYMIIMGIIIGLIIFFFLKIESHKEKKKFEINTTICSRCGNKLTITRHGYYCEKCMKYEK